MAAATAVSSQEEPIVVSMQPWNVKGYFSKEIQKMMHGFGDSANALEESAFLVEEFVQQQLMIILNRAAELAERRESKTIDPEDLLFLMRRDAILIHRLLKYLAIKDWRRKLPNENYEGDLVMETDVVMNGKLSRVYLEYLKTIDQTGELTDPALIPADIIKHERNVRAERTSRVLSEEKYMDFVIARRASFANPRSFPKFCEWVLSAGEEKLEIHNKATFDILGFLAYETVAEIVDLALLVRQDSKAKPGDPFSCYLTTPGYSRISTLPRCPYPTDSTILQIDEAMPLAPEEIEEAIRRASSCQFKPFFLFNRNPTLTINSDILIM